MTSNSLPLKKAILVCGDLAAAIVALSVALLIRHGGVPESFLIRLYFFAAPFLLLLWLAGFLVFGLYDLKAAKNEPRFFERLFKANLFNLALTVVLFYFIPAFRLKPLTTLIIIFTALGALITGWRAAYNAALAKRTKEQVLFFGINGEVAETAKFLSENPQLGFSAAAFLKSDSDQPEWSISAGGPVLALGKNLPDIVKEYNISRIVITHDLRKTEALARSLFAVVPLGVTIVDLSRFYESVAGKVPTSLINELWFIENLIGMRRPKYDFVKRVMDLALALLFGLAALTLLPFAAFGIMLSTPKDILGYKRKRARAGDGLIFFRQKRMGRNGRTFDFVKLRSQVLGAERMGGFKEIAKDSRAYPFGSFLRKTYLDELPQLWNVLKGEMSFVGPRPERPEFVKELENKIPFYRMRELTLPGITGWAQINMADDASVEDAPEKLQYDLYYIKNRSIALDVAILLKTALKLLQRSGR